MAFLNGAGSHRRGTHPRNGEELQLLNALLAGTSERPPQGDKTPSLDRSKSKDERKAEQESEEPTFSKPGGFKNQPDDPTNPNEARERVRQKLTP
jgi:hypothetical protein